MDSKQNGVWYVATCCDAIDSDMTFLSCAIVNQRVLILWRIKKIGRSDKLATRP